MNHQDIYIRLIDPSGKRNPVVNAHRVWDRQRFIKAQKNLHEVKADPKDKLVVELATEAEYRAFKNYKGAAA